MHRFLITLGLLGLVIPAQARAHPALTRSEPASGAVLKSPPSVVSLWFSETIEPVFNKIEVFDTTGAHNEDGKATVDGTDKKLLRVYLKALPVGAYEVRWTASSADSHKMGGGFRFEVRP